MKFLCYTVFAFTFFNDEEYCNRCSVHLNVVLACYKNVFSFFIIIIDLKSQATGDMKDSNEQQKMSSAQNNNEGTVSYAPCSLI